jgi:hypothetical protein
VLLLFATAAHGQEDKVFSGPQPGEMLTSFKVLGYSGPAAGKEVDLIGQLKGGPAVLVFVHEVTRPAFQMLRPIDTYGAQLAREGLATHFIWLTADKTQTEAFLTRASKSLNLQSPVSISLDGLEGPGNYGLNRKVTLTILVARDNKVVANFAIVQPNETDAPKVAAAIARLMGKKPPSLQELQGGKGGDKVRPKEVRPGEEILAIRKLQDEIASLRKQVEMLTDALNDARAQIAKLQGVPAPPPLPKELKDKPVRPKVKDGEGKPSANPELQMLMRRMIQKDNDEATVKRIAEEMRQWAGTDRKRSAELRDYCRMVVRLGYGNEHAQKALKSLAGD